MAPASVSSMSSIGSSSSGDEKLSHIHEEQLRFEMQRCELERAQERAQLQRGLEGYQHASEFHDREPVGRKHVLVRRRREQYAPQQHEEQQPALHNGDVQIPVDGPSGAQASLLATWSSPGLPLGEAIHKVKFEDWISQLVGGEPTDSAISRSDDDAKVAWATLGTWRGLDSNSNGPPPAPVVGHMQHGLPEELDTELEGQPRQSLSPKTDLAPVQQKPAAGMPSPITTFLDMLSRSGISGSPVLTVLAEDIAGSFGPQIGMGDITFCTSLLHHWKPRQELPGMAGLHTPVPNTILQRAAAAGPYELKFQEMVPLSDTGSQVLLLAHGIDVNAVYQDGSRPLHLVVRNNALGTFQALLDMKRTDINAKDAMGRTPLHLAALLRRETMAVQLLQCGADLAAIDADGRTAIHMVLTPP